MTELAAASHSAGVGAPPGGQGGVARKKFAVPPVKSACLACRAARTRCDGAKPCATCQTRIRDCVYLPSRRGGPRCRKKPRPDRDVADDPPKPIPENVLAVLSQEPTDSPREVSVQDYIDPGAGLKQLEDWVPDSDFIFDSLFMSSIDPNAANGLSPEPTKPVTSSQLGPMVRTYQSDAAILDAYYVFIHPYLPILPPPYTTPIDSPTLRLQNQLDVVETAYEPTSPLALAISAILALIPCPEDECHMLPESQIFRRKYAQFFAQSAFETIENDDEIPDSAIEPTRALSEEHRHNFRLPFHPQVPVELENIIALAILSVYEYAQRGNLKKMQNRAGQALMAAMDLSLHSCTIQDEFSEARRRVWWISYVCASQASIVNNTKPSFMVVSPTYAADLPTCLADPEAFSVFMQSQRAILAATQFVIELNKAIKENADMAPIHRKMTELENSIEPLLARSEPWLLPATTTSPLDPAETVLARSLRCMATIKLNSARIKVHRYCAFFDIPVFSGKHCDLKSLRATDHSDDLRQWPMCSCSSFSPYPASASTPTSSSHSAGLSPASDGTGPKMSAPASIQAQTPPRGTPAAAAIANSFPFTSHQSAKICLRSALNIARSFDELPYPNPTGMQQPLGPPVFLSPTSGIICPRTMPSFACCAMQCAYALLMVFQKTKSLYPFATTDGLGGSVSGGAMGFGQVPTDTKPAVVGSLLVRLQQGLMSIYATLENYSTAFEALGGMRDQIRIAVGESQLLSLG